jgi:hypothetical protein
MPHIPDSRHADHDPLAIAAYAAGDATGDELDTARALVAACADCATLHADLRAISAALPELPVPSRPRDFQLTPDQAASLRPAGWRRLLAPLAGPRFAFAGPLGGGLATLGIAGLLVAGSLSAPLAATPAEGDPGMTPEAIAMEASSPEAPTVAANAPQGQAAPSGAPAAGNDGDAPTSARTSNAPVDPAASPVDTSGEYGTGVAGGAGGQPPDSIATMTTMGEIAGVPDGSETRPLTDGGASQTAATGLVGAGLLAVGLVLAGLRFIARRAS